MKTLLTNKHTHKTPTQYNRRDEKSKKQKNSDDKNTQANIVKLSET